jgi:hypothetical protein
MKLITLMRLVDEAYGDGQVMACNREPSGNHGDGLARFVEAEIRETFEPGAITGNQIKEAIRKMETAREDLDRVVRTLRRILPDE